MLIRPRPPASTFSRALRGILPENPLLEVLGGLISAMVAITLAISFAGLVFSGKLGAYYPVGIGLALISTVLIGAAVALGGSFSGTIAGPQDKPAAILGASLASTGMLLSDHQLLPTAIALVAVTSLVFGLAIYLIGYFKLGGIVRYMPYPVIGGFLAGTGWLILRGAFEFVGSPLDLPHAYTLLQPENLVRWLPAAIFGGTLCLSLRRRSHVMVLPAFIVGGVVISYALLFVLDTVSPAADAGLLLGRLPGSMWRPDLILQAASNADWRYLGSNALTVAAVVLVSTIAMLLNETGIEVASRARLELDRDLRSTGFANILTGLGGGFPGYAFIGLSILNHRLGVSTRFVGMLTALIPASVLFYGADLLSFFPRWVVAGMLFYLAFDFLTEWLLDSRHTCTTAEYGVILFIMVCIVVFGFLQGIGVGIIVMAIVFVLSYSRIDIVKSELTGSEQQSNVQRSPREAAFLNENGGEMVIFELQGYLFFGTTNRIFERVVQRLEGSTCSALRFLVLDFRRVSGVDASAVFSFLKLRHFAEAHGFAVAFTHLGESLIGKLRRGGCIKDDAVCIVFPDMDRGVEWCEEQLLRRMDAPRADAGLMQLLRQHAGDDALLARMRSRLVRQEWSSGSYVFRRDDPPDGMYFIESGSVSIILDSPGTESARLLKLGSGTVFGEMGGYTRMPRSASVIVDENCVLYHLPEATILDMEQHDPGLASAFHRYIVWVLSQRLERANKALFALRR